MDGPGSTSQSTHDEILRKFYLLRVSFITARKRSLGQGNMLTGVCLFTGMVPGSRGRGVCSGGVPAPEGAWWRPPPRTATAAGGTHLTGMHSCLLYYWYTVKSQPLTRDISSKIVYVNLPFNPNV